MIELETQVVKIHLGDSKQATSYVYTLAEKIDASESELYMICELPLFNPAAADECQRIAEAIAGSLKRSYRKTVTKQTFENALGIINEELGKLVSMNKAHWLGKLNAVLAVKHGQSLSVTSTGKISGLLYREGNFAPIIEPSTPNHPLKTFENFSVGKLRLNDLLVLSTAQLFNHISVDRIKNILRRNELPDAAQEIISTMQDATGPEVACGTILALQVEPTAEPDEEVDLQTYQTGPLLMTSGTAANNQSDDNWLDRLKSIKSTATTIGKNIGSDLKEKIKRQKISNILKGNADTIGMVQNQFKRVSSQFQPAAIKGYSRQKKFFMISAAILLIALITNIAIAKYFKATRNEVPLTASVLESLDKLGNDANAAFLYGDEPKAVSLLSDLQQRLNDIGTIPADQRVSVDKIKAQAQGLRNKIDKVAEADVTTIGSLGNANHLIELPTYLATETNRTIVSYNRSSSSIQDNVLKSSEPITRSTFFKGNQAVIYNGSELLLWNFQTGIIGGAFSDMVPNQNSAAGLKVYSVNSRAYVIDKSQNRVISFAVTDKNFSKPTVSISNVPELSSASDLAIDGNIYITAGGTILKFNSGARQDFTPQVSRLSDNVKIVTQADFNNIYLLDIGNKRIVILNKNGELIKSLTSTQFNDLKDFTVDEKSKTMFILNNTALLKVSY
ncbi:MAG: hypothetical protein M3Q64_01690 [bacterium]|nr:hypothetical protein [bacterium]